MTESRDAASVLPLSLTCAPDPRFAGALRAVVGRVGALAGEPSRAAPFVDAVQQVVGWALAHADGIRGEIAMQFARDGDRLAGDLRWATAADASVPLPPSRSDDVLVTCDVAGTDVHCRVSCRCA